MKSTVYEAPGYAIFSNSFLMNAFEEPSSVRPEGREINQRKVDFCENQVFSNSLLSFGIKLRVCS
jgi:hypothetical protein